MMASKDVSSAVQGMAVTFAATTPTPVDTVGTILHATSLATIATCVVGLAEAAVMFTVFFKDKDRLKTSSNVLVLNINFSGCLFFVVTIMYELAAWDYEHFPSEAATVWQTFSMYVLCAGVFVTAYSLLVVAVMLYMTIAHQISTAPHTTTKRAKQYAAAVWVSSLIGACIFSAGKLSTVLVWLFCIFSYFVPLVSISIFYILIAVYLKKQRNPQFAAFSASVLHPSTLHELVLLIDLVLVFAACWTPVMLNYLLIWGGVFPSFKVSATQVMSIRRLCVSVGFCVNTLVGLYSLSKVRWRFTNLVKWSRLCDIKLCRQDNESERDDLALVGNADCMQ